MREIEAPRWDALLSDGNPFLSHAFLAALEDTGCVDEDSGWIPRHFVLEEDGRMLGAMPAYLKLHSYGEFVFDWGWADAYERAGQRYYPKLLCAVPFTPATGPRLLAAADTDPALLARGLVSASMQFCEQGELSSSHWLFPHPSNVAELRALPLLERWGCQYHWHNPGYRDFQDYLDALTSKRRKQVRKERREAAASGLEVQALMGAELREREIADYHELYCSTYDRKWGMPSLTLDFFLQVAEKIPESLMLVLARRGAKVIAGAHLLCGGGTLFGRNWGCREQHRSLHFEVCYYQGIEQAIERGLARFEAGAQGEHKITRGFLPVKTHSFHFLRERRFRDAVNDFLQRERADVEHHLLVMAGHSPFREGGRGAQPDGDRSR
jgi:predicted N-acyltransferase